VIEARWQQRSFADGFLSEVVEEFWDDWMRAVDRVLDDEDLVATVYDALRRRRPQSRTRGRLGFPAEVVLRLLLLKHIRAWSFVVLEREVRTNLLYREFTRVRGGKVPDAKTLGRLAQAVGPEVVAALHERVVAIARREKVIAGRKMRVETTVVETNIHYPTDSSLLGDGVRVLTRLMKKVTALAGEAGTTLRDRTRSVKYRLIEIGRSSRTRGEPAREKLKTLYQRLLATTGRVVGQAKRFVYEIAQGEEQCRCEGASRAGRLKQELEEMLRGSAGDAANPRAGAGGRYACQG
jgi:IS5 family transposase